MSDVGTESAGMAVTAKPAAASPPDAAAAQPEKRTLAPQQSLHDMTEIPTPQGLAKREITKFTNTWNNICKNSMVCDGKKLQEAAIVSHEGSVYSSHPPEFLPTIEQIKTIVSAMTNPGLLAMKGIKVDEMDYKYDQCQVSGSTAHCFTGLRQDGDGGVLIYFTKHLILIGVYRGEGEPVKERAISHMEEIWEWVKETGF